MVICQLAARLGVPGCLAWNLPRLRLETRGLTLGRCFGNQAAAISRATQRKASLRAVGGKARVRHYCETSRAECCSE